MGDIAGRIGELAVSTNGSTYTDVGGVTDGDWSGQTDTVDVTDFDSGGWKEHLDTNAGASFSASANWDEADAGLMIVHDAWEDKTPLYIRWRPAGTGTGNKEYIGIGSITSFDESQAQDGKAEVSFEWMLNGTPTIQDQT